MNLKIKGAYESGIVCISKVLVGKQHAYEFGCVSTSLILSMKLKMQGVDTRCTSELLQFRGLYK